MFVGGVEAQQNYERYYIETLRFYEQLTDTLNYKPEYVWVLAADGTDTAADKNTGTFADPVYENSDFSSITGNGSTVLSATDTNLQNTINGLDLAPEDLLLLWTYDHGDGTEANTSDHSEETLCGWGGDITDDDLAAYIGNINAGREVYVFSQCFAGGMLEELNITTGNGQFGCGPGDAIPEPAALGLLTIGAAALLRRRRR